MAGIILVLSAHANAGQTTITVNLASALARQGHRVLIAEKGENKKLRAWLGFDRAADRPMPSSGQMMPGTVATRIGTDFWMMKDAERILPEIAVDYEYVFLLPATSAGCENLLPRCDRILVCCSLEEKDTARQVVDLDQHLSSLTGRPQPIDLVVMNKINTKEWHNNLECFSLLADHFGEERIADPLPHCERIHDLPLDGRTVWELSQENLQDAFMRLIEIIKLW